MKNAKTISQTPIIGQAVDLAMGTVGFGVRLFSSALRLPGLLTSTPERHVSLPGERPGIEHLRDINVPPEPGQIRIECIEYSADRIEREEVDDLKSFLDTPSPDWATSRWINVVGLHPYTINQFSLAFGFHTLTAEDVLHVPQRPRSEFFDDHVYTVLRMLTLTTENADEQAPVGDGDILQAEQISLFLYKDTLITFQEAPGDVWQPIRERLQVPNSRIRRNGSAYLLYALIDAIVDHCFPVLEQYGNVLEQLELDTLERSSPEVLQRIHAVKRELSLVRRMVWPTRELVSGLYRDEFGHISDNVRPFLRDVYEHTIQIVEIIESYREMVGGLTDLYVSMQSNRMNEVMKVLTMMASLFIPLTFIAGIYGMNFEHMPELSQPLAYPLVWVAFIGVTGAMLLYFRIKGWIGGG